METWSLRFYIRKNCNLYYESWCRQEHGLQGLNSRLLVRGQKWRKGKAM